MKMRHFHCHCTVEAEEVGSHLGDRGIQRVASEGVEGAHVAPSPYLSGRSRCPVGPGCVPSAARPSSSSPWLLAGSCHRNHPARPWCHRRRRRRHTGDFSPYPSDHPGCGCVSLGGHWGSLCLLSADLPGNSRAACGRHSRGRGRCGRYCSNHHPS